MTLRDLFTDKTLWAKYGDMDIYNDVTDDYFHSWCGTLLTDYGKEVYAHILDYEIDLQDDNWLGNDHKCIVVLLDKRPDWEDRYEEARAFFEDMAGYIPEEDFNKRFII